MTGDASIVFISHRALTRQPPGTGVYHLPARHHYGTKTRCGIVLWDNDQREVSVLPIRRDTACLIARVCGKCAAEYARLSSSDTGR